MYPFLFQIEILKHSEHNENNSKFIINSITIGLFLLLLIVGWFETRLMCHYNLPSDCNHQINNWDIYKDTSNILLKGLVLISISNLTENIKKIKNKVLLLLYLCLYLITGPIFAICGELPGMQTSLATFTIGFNPSCITYFSCLIFTLSVISYELYKIFKYYKYIYLFSYIFSRSLIFLYYLIFSLVLSKQYYIHIHHLYIGFAIACLAHDHKIISWIALSIGSGIMVQGIGSYGFATIIED